MKTAITALFSAVLLCSISTVQGGRPPGGPGGPGKTPPAPDIVYMVLGGRSVKPSTEIRGETLSIDGRGSTDSSLVKAAFNRDHTSIVWAPDGSRFAWLQDGAIMAASPGKTPSVLYDPTTDSNRPKADMEGDALAWAPDCRGGTALAFKSYQPHGVFFIWFDGDGTAHDPVPLVVMEEFGTVQGMAFSPGGRYLAVAGWGDAFESAGINLVPMCGDDHTPSLLIGASELVGDSGFMEVRSMDWSRHGERIALSITTSDDPDYPWRDLKIIDLSYSRTDTDELISYWRIWRVDLDLVFGSASSEHSPQWGPSDANDVCQRIAFSQSAGVSDGSDSNGRHMYLLDIGQGGLGGCDINEPLLIDSKYPRALDWK